MTLAPISQAGLAVLVIAVATLAEAHGGRPRAHKPTPEETAAFEAAKPVFDRYCFRCHTSAGKKSKPKAMEHIAMDRYPFGGHHAGEAGNAIRKVLGADGKSKATMPSDDRGAVGGDELAKILAWADAFDRANAGKRANTKRDNDHAD